MFGQQNIISVLKLSVLSIGFSIIQLERKCGTGNFLEIKIINNAARTQTQTEKF